MGGLALKHTGTRRYTKNEFYSLAGKLLPQIEKAFNTKAVLVLSYRNKESFGDMDILVLNDRSNMVKDAERIIRETFNPTDVVKNSSVISFDHQELQIDLIFTPVSNWETSQVFFAYNDLGNLMGKIFHRFGLKYGFDGLKYVYRIDNDRILDEIIISKNMPLVFSFLGLSWERFEQGFDNLEDIFDYVISSPYFNPESFKLENLNAINRRRNNRRKVYNQFVEYVKDMEPKYDFYDNRDSYIPQIALFFPEANLIQRIADLYKLELKKKVNHAKFNGTLIMERFPELSGPILGKALYGFRELITKPGNFSFDDYLEHHSSEQIFKDFTNFYQNGSN